MRDTTSEEEDLDPELSGYEEQVRQGIAEAHPYDRLMIAYRKGKDYNNELRVIKRAIAVFEGRLKQFQDAVLKGYKKRSKVMELSKSISKKTGLADNRGRATHVPEPIARWQKRQAVVEKKIAAASGRKKKSR